MNKWIIGLFILLAITAFYFYNPTDIFSHGSFGGAGVGR